MITRIEIDGFKTFHDFILEPGPFQVIVGLNGTGKSNLFDALHLLARLADTDLHTAFQDLRGESGELFRLLPNGQPTNRMSIAVELLINRSIKDSWGTTVELKFTRLRYKVTIARQYDEHGMERLSVVHEHLSPIPRGSDTWVRRYVDKTIGNWLPRLTGGRSSPFISTNAHNIALHQDGHSGLKSIVAEQLERTILSSVSNTEFPHALAVREEMRSWRFPQLNPAVLRQPGAILASNVIAADTHNVPNALARLQRKDALLMTNISRDLAHLVPGITSISLDTDTDRDRSLIRAHTEDGQIFSSRVLSDSTLRMLTLVTLKNDPEHQGLLCLEEPEHGVHPFQLAHVAQLLRNLATDFHDPTQQHRPLRQLFVNTHSPILAGQPGIYDALLLAQMVHHAQPGQEGLRMTQMVRVAREPRNMQLTEEQRQHIIDQVLLYLQSANIDEAMRVLKG
ncbi:MAG: AAA family ATPase [Chloroflexaceae bacterium]|nr:AAA family ATPase [Chloroflexaceae bacterium]